MKHKMHILIVILSILFTSLFLSGCGDSSVIKTEPKSNPDRGDINLNETAYEISDAVLFTNYFLHGELIFEVDKERQIIATDANADWQTLSVADFVYLVRVIAGDVLPYPQDGSFPTDTVEVTVNYNLSGQLSVPTSVRIGAVHLVVEGKIAPGLLLGLKMSTKYIFNGTNTHIFISSLDGDSFTGYFLAIHGRAIVSIEMATAEGNPIALTINRQ